MVARFKLRLPVHIRHKITYFLFVTVNELVTLLLL
jgi:hypothetical protein